jgi:hypothetical protein
MGTGVAMMDVETILAPYRKPPRDPDGSDEPAAARWDDRVLGFLMIALGAPRVVIALAQHEHFGAEATLAAIMAGLGLLILAARR